MNTIKDLQYHLFMKHILKYIVLFFTSLVNAQNKVNDNYNALKIGDRMPDIILNKIVNYSRDSAKISDFKGKLLIMDFWNLHCPPCISGMIKMQELQKKFEGKIQILLVNSFNSDIALNKAGFPKKTSSPILNHTQLPFLIGCKELNKMFPHAGEPYHVWIDKDGIIKALTTSYGTTESNIQKYFSGEPLDMPVMGNPDDLEVSSFQSFLKPKNEVVLKNLLYTSVITRNLNTKGIEGLIYDSSLNKIVGVRTSGFPLDMLRGTFENKAMVPVDRVLIETRNPEKLIGPQRDEEKPEWLVSNYFYYELILPEWQMSHSEDSNRTKINELKREDLQRFFNVTINLEKRKTKCWVVVSKNPTKFLSLKSEELGPFEEKTKDYYILKNNSFDVFILSLQWANISSHPMPIINESGIDPLQKVTMRINAPLNDINRVRTGLLDFGLDIIEQEREIELLVIRNK